MTFYFFILLRKGINIKKRKEKIKKTRKVDGETRFENKVSMFDEFLCKRQPQI